MRAVLDTNALLMPFQFGINLERELGRLLGSCEILVPSCVADELATLDDRHSKAALALASRYRSLECAPAPSVDECLLAVSRESGTVIVTNDKNLQIRITGSGGRVAAMRGRNHLVLLPGGRE